MPARNEDNEHPHSFDGAYEPSELASYFRASVPIGEIAPSAQRLRAWAHTGKLGPDKPEKVGRLLRLNFNQLATSQVVAILRARNWSFQRIANAEHQFVQLLGTRWPFANRDFWTMGGDLLTRYEGTLMVGTRAGQFALEEIVREWLHPVGRHFDFDPRTGQAITWRPIEGIELDPRFQFGAPLVEGTSIPTASLWSYVRGGDPIGYVARVYALEVADVERAVAWEDRRRGLVGAAA